jgi:hypothetical protein
MPNRLQIKTGCSPEFQHKLVLGVATGRQKRALQQCNAKINDRASTESGLSAGEFFCDIQTNYGKNRKTTMIMNNSNVPHMVNIRVIPIFKANH